MIQNIIVLYNGTRSYGTIYYQQNMKELKQ